MDSNRLAPTQQRLEHLDVLRGFALLGILLVNFEWFTRPLQAIVLGVDPGLAGLDAASDWLIRAVAEGKFYPLFSMLFGAGFALMLERAEARQAPFWGLYLRRLLVLLVFGAIHMLLVWAGDILLIYALCGFMMVLLFRKTPTGRLWKWAVAFIVLPVVLMWMGALAIWGTQGDPALHESIMAGFEADAGALQERVAVAAEVHAAGSWVENVGQRLSDARFTLANFVFWVPPILGYFLIGRWLIATGRLVRPDQHRLFFRRWRSRGLIVGLPLAVLGASLLHGANWSIPTPSVAVGVSATTVGALFLSLAYLSMVTLASDRLRFLAPAGRMALTNYLLQSLFWTWTFYGHGLGLWGQLPRATHIVVVLAFFAAQVVLSIWWMRHFRYGPAEWLWRSLIYLRRQPMRAA